MDKPLVTLKVFPESREDLRRIAEITGEKHCRVIDRILKKELKEKSKTTDQ